MSIPCGSRPWGESLGSRATAVGNPVSITGDFLEDSRLIEALQTGVPPDFDVYDAATWSVVSALVKSPSPIAAAPSIFPTSEIVPLSAGSRGYSERGLPRLSGPFHK